MITSVIFYAFGGVLLAAALGVILSRNPVYSALCLVLAFFTSAVLWILLEAEFLGIVLVLVYVGAVMVLFLFVVMMLDINVEKLKGSLAQYGPFGLVIAALMAAQIGYVVWYRSFGDSDLAIPAGLPEGVSNTEQLGAVLYTEYVYPFELAAVILLVAIVAAIMLTMRKRAGLRVQDIHKQVSVRREDRVRLVNMPAAKRGGDGPSESAAPGESS